MEGLCRSLTREGVAVPEPIGAGLSFGVFERMGRRGNDQSGERSLIMLAAFQKQCVMWVGPMVCDGLSYIHNSLQCLASWAVMQHKMFSLGHL